MFKTITAITLLALTTYTTGGAHAQGTPPCAPRGIIVERLETKYGEEQKNFTIAPGGNLVELFASDEAGTWTILLSMPNGTSCVMRAGRGWQGNTAVETPGSNI